MEYKQVIRDLSEQIVKAQKPIRILDSIKWDISIQQQFFATKGQELPCVDADYYQKNNPLPYDPDLKIEEFKTIEHNIRRVLGQHSGVAVIMLRMCQEYCRVIEMQKARGKGLFYEISQELYGSSEDTLHIGAPSFKDFAILTAEALANIKDKVSTEADIKKYSSAETVAILGQRLANFFTDKNQTPKVELSDGIISDASAGAERIKIHNGLKFSERDIRVFEIHEGWVHLGTTLNGMAQPICTFLSKGPPSSTITQEGLAIITELFTFSSYPGRVQRLTDRVTAISMAEAGANFIDVYQYFLNHGCDEVMAYHAAARVFRGSNPNGKPFTKDLSYSKGFLLIYNYIRLAIQKGLIEYVPLLFVGKTSLDDIHILAELVHENIVTPPKYLPPQFKDLAALSAWMCYSLFLNKLNLQQMAIDFKAILQ